MTITVSVHFRSLAPKVEYTNTNMKPNLGHCPEGVEEPTTPPGSVPNPAQPPAGEEKPGEGSNDNGCVAHDDHCTFPHPRVFSCSEFKPSSNAGIHIGHCPEGVEEPTNPPGSAPNPAQPASGADDGDHGATDNNGCVAHDDHCMFLPVILSCRLLEFVLSRDLI